jgi:GH25 family lysozyme M1 (1,4-beta-N-acetylmuramidase)
MSRTPGIDVSQHQGEINWRRVVAAGHRFAFVRATLGNDGTDLRFYTNWKGAKDVGLLVSVYHVVKPYQSADSQIYHLFDVLGDRKPDMPIALDVERKDHCSREVITACVRDCLRMVEQRDSRRPIIYTAGWFWNPNVLPSSDWSDYDLWVANYGVSTPTLPSGWNEWRFWQYSEDGHVPGIDTAETDLDWFNGSYEELLEYADKPAFPRQQPRLLVGLHDEDGGDWMRSQNMEGICLVHRAVQTQPVTINCQSLALAGIKVLARLNWGYAGGTGTVPPPEHKDDWVHAICGTIAASRGKGVWGWIIGNEVNNPIEWPGGHPHPTHIVSPAYYVELYNRIWWGVEKNDLMAPAPLDPYNVVAREFGQPADPRDWAQYIYAHIDGADFLALHAKTQTNRPTDCQSDARFTDPPLIGRFLHLRTIEDQLTWVPTRLWDKDIYVTEVNPQRRSDNSLGWEPGNTEWVRRAHAYLREQPVDGAIYYRYARAGDQTGFGLDNNPAILQAIREEA